MFRIITHPPSYFNSKMAYTICVNPTLWLNLNYRKLLKYVNTASFLRIDLKYKKDKNVEKPHHISDLSFTTHTNPIL